MRILLNTLIDIGFKRIILRIKYQFKIFFDNLFYKSTLYLLLKKYKVPRNNYPLWNDKIVNLNKKKRLSIKKYADFSNKKIPINFVLVNKLNTLITPIKWNDKKRLRLWQFHLHYFNWLRDWIEKDIKAVPNSISIDLVDYFIEEWISSNPKGSFDGWHSYTISIRIRNWILFLCIYKERLKENYLNSIWEQIIWLYNHPEDCHGGNHWIENLTALIFGSLFFDSKESNIIYKNSIFKLEKELRTQILADGGHEERSVSYHILMLDRLVEIACLIRIHKKNEIKLLEKKIINMYIWLEKVRSKYEILPRFNDNLYQNPEVVDEILRFTLSFINHKNYCKKGTRYQLIESCNFTNKTKNITINKSIIDYGILDLPDTGWFVLKPNKDWYLTFKCGESCPKHLPAHVHSDILSFDLFYKDTPLLVGSGSSTYQKGDLRDFERSTISRNTLQLGNINAFGSDKFTWIEPTEIWSTFRAGRKAKTTIRNYGTDSDGNLWVYGGHDGFKNIKASYERKIIFIQKTKYKIDLKIIDYLKLSKKTAWRSCWHLAPGIEESTLNPVIKFFTQNYDAKYNWKTTHFSINLNKTIPRRSLYIHGILNPGSHNFKNIISFDCKNKIRKRFNVDFQDNIFF